MDLTFPDRVIIYPVESKDRYGNTVPGDPYTIPAIYQQAIEVSHNDRQDGLTTTAPLILPGDDAFVTEHAYRLEGMIVQINPFGASDSSQYFKITEANPVRDVLLDNEVRQVECQLSKAVEFAYVS